MRKLTAGLIGAAIAVTSIALLRTPRPSSPSRAKEVEPIPAGEKVPSRISLERLRELGY